MKQWSRNTSNAYSPRKRIRNARRKRAPKRDPGPAIRRIRRGIQSRWRAPRTSTATAIVPSLPPLPLPLKLEQIILLVLTPDVPITCIGGTGVRVLVVVVFVELRVRIAEFFDLYIGGHIAER